jgi:hypothetical protein
MASGPTDDFPVLIVYLWKPQITQITQIGTRVALTSRFQRDTWMTGFRDRWIPSSSDRRRPLRGRPTDDRCIRKSLTAIRAALSEAPPVITVAALPLSVTAEFRSTSGRVTIRASGHPEIPVSVPSC